ncbi:hypothetical protein M3398_31715 [Streptomyces albidoflavus]|uniref:ATP-binding protein n=1 Tax=Streptomyces albidoflavus TaxID=1886 RepID=UPI0020BE16C7|nr:hypothetical protein [Streptomyces albidoflavus]MCL6281825.1 hypothetical protein [Streptomyces albidoflavus]
MSEITHGPIPETISEVPAVGELVDAQDRFRGAVELPGTGTEGPAPAPVDPAPAEAPEVAAAPLPVDPATEWAILPDPEGDAPLRPAWTRTREGVSHRARYARRQAARRARRSIRRQATPHGTLQRSGRGVRRVHEWIAGTEGIAAQAAAASARRAAIEARQAARTARFAVLDRKGKTRAAEQAAETLASELKTWKSARGSALRGRLMRGSVAYGPTLGGVGAAYAEAGGLGALTAATAVFLSASWLGRRYDGDQEFHEVMEGRVLDPGMTPAAFGRMLRDALEEDLGVKVADLHVRGHVWGFEAAVQLFKAKPADVTAKLDDLEACLVARPGSLLVQQSSKARPLFTLRALNENPWAGMASLPYRAPLSQRIAEDIPLGQCLTQEPLHLPLLRTNGVLVGGPGSGKSTALLAIAEALTACEDVVVWDIDLGSSGAGLDPMGAAIQRRATNKADAKTLLLDALAIAKGRPRLFKKLGMGRNWQPSPTHPALVLLIDEYPALVAAGLFPLVSEIIRTGRKSAVNVLMAAQGASKDFLGAADPASVPLRIALPCQGQDVTRLMGAGAIAEGWAAHRLAPAEGNEARDASVCYIRSGRHAEPIPYRFAWLGDDDAEQRAEERRAAGLPQLDEDSLLVAGIDELAALEGEAEVWAAEADQVDEDGEYVAADEQIELPELPAAVLAILREHDAPAMATGEILAALKAADPDRWGAATPVGVGRALSEFGAGARAYGRGRGVYLADMVGAAAEYRPQPVGV